MSGWLIASLVVLVVGFGIVLHEINKDWNDPHQ